MCINWNTSTLAVPYWCSWDTKWYQMTLFLSHQDFNTKLDAHTLAFDNSCLDPNSTSSSRHQSGHHTSIPTDLRMPANKRQEKNQSPSHSPPDITILHCVTDDFSDIKLSVCMQPSITWGSKNKKSHSLQPDAQGGLYRCHLCSC